MVVAWILIVGFFAGSVARLLMPGPRRPKGFFVTTMIGVAGAILASFGGEFLGVYHLYVGAGPLAATVGAVIILSVWNRLVTWGVIEDHGL